MKDTAAPSIICSRCIYGSDIANISFDEQGVCNYCRQIDDLAELYGTGKEKGKNEWLRLVDEIKAAGKGKKYDCIVGVSGGADSSFMVYQALEYGLRPLAVHYDDTWNSAIASENIRKVLEDTGVDLFTLVMDNKESDDIFRSFFKAGVPEMGTPTDLALAETLYIAAGKYGLKHVLEGHSFIEEGVSPVGKNYFDGKYIKSIHDRYGSRPMKTYPLMTFTKFMRSLLVSKIQKIRPYWYLDYSKDEAREFLEKKCGWQYYGGHHLENRLVAFSMSIYLPTKFGLDYRNLTLAAKCRNGLMTREAALHEYSSPPHAEKDLLSYFKKRLGLDDAEYQSLMCEPPKYWWQFPTYKRRFELLRPLFKILAGMNLVPMSFYLKYCFPVGVKNDCDN